MSKKIKCPCCGSIHGEKHDPACALVAYMASITSVTIQEGVQLRRITDWPALKPGQVAPEPPPEDTLMFKDQPLSEPGYERLAAVLARAFDQAARGKGKERHANGEPFHEQVMQDGARRFGVGALLFQAFKKSEESQRLPLERGVNELLGAIVYLAGAVIAREAEAQSTTTN